MREGEARVAARDRYCLAPAIGKPSLGEGCSRWSALGGSRHLCPGLKDASEMGLLRGTLLKPNVEKLNAKRDVEGLIDALTWRTHDDDGIAVAAARALGEIGDGRAASALIYKTFLEGARTNERVAAAREALCKIGEPAVDELIGALRTSSLDDLGLFAAEVLGEIGEPAIEPLIKAVREPDATIRIRAAFALGEIGEDGVVEVLIAAFRDPDPRVRRAALNALEKTNDRRAIEPLIAGLADEDASVAGDAILIAMRRMDPSVVALAESDLKDDDEEVRQRAAYALRRGLLEHWD
jgi:hypothetical protein